MEIDTMGQKIISKKAFACSYHKSPACKEDTDNSLMSLSLQLNGLNSMTFKMTRLASMLAHVIVPFAVAPFMLSACGDDAPSNDTNKAEPEVLGEVCTHENPADLTFEFKVPGFNGNPVPDALVCVTPDKNSANCSGSIISVRTDINGTAKLRISHQILKDYRFVVQSPLYSGFDIFEPDDIITFATKNAGVREQFHLSGDVVSPELNVKKDILAAGDVSVSSTYTVTAEPIHDLVTLFMKHGKLNRQDAIEAFAASAETTPDFIEAMLRLNTPFAKTYSRAIGALNLKQKRLNISILSNYIKGSVPIITKLVSEGVPDHQIVLAIKRKSTKSEFPSADDIKVEASKNKNIRPPAVENRSYVEQLANSTHSRAIRSIGERITLNSRIRVDNSYSSNRSKNEGNCDPRNVNIDEDYIWLLPDGQRATGRTATVNYGSEDTGSVAIDNIVCTKDAFGSICAEDTLKTNIYDDKTITDDMLTAYTNSFRLTHRMLRTLSDGSSEVEFNITADPGYARGIEGMFSVELNPGDISGRLISVPMNNGQGKVVYTYAPGPHSMRAILRVESYVTNSINGNHFFRNDTDFITLKAKSAMPEGTKLVAIQAGGCGRDRTNYYFKLVNPYKPDFAKDLRNARLTWTLGNIVKTSNTADTSVPIDTNRLDFKKATTAWGRYSVKLTAGREVFNYTLSDVRDRTPGICGPLDTLKLHLSDVTETGFKATAQYDYFEAWDAETVTRWIINGQEIPGTGQYGRSLNLNNLKCGTTVNVVAQAELAGQSRRFETAVNLRECGSSGDATTMKWLEKLKLRASVGETGVVLFSLRSPDGFMPNADTLENITVEADFGDGFSEIMPFSPNFTHEYLTPGEHEVSLRLYYGGKVTELSVTPQTAMSH